MFRKVFEKLLLGEFDQDGWARLHLMQAGFQAYYLTYTNASLVHYALASGLAQAALFLDFRAAFNVIDHARLAAVLQERRCPEVIYGLIWSLTFQELRSRVVVNGIPAPWFTRTWGVLQGSPLSPYLFNLFVDLLIQQLNDSASRLPRAVFYADDGALLGNTTGELQGLINQVCCWSNENSVQINVSECGYIRGNPSMPPLDIEGEMVPITDEYNYLGFPVTKDGIAFEAFLKQRLRKAKNLTKWLSKYSDDWGPAHRL